VRLTHLLAVACVCVAVGGAAATPPAPPPDPKPTLANVPYGPDPRQVLDFWRADAAAPTPLMFYLHGGSWESGSKKFVAGLRPVLAAGISVVSVEYRVLSQARLAGVQPPVQWPFHDAARALQFVRSKAAEWNIDPTRIGVAGNSAGACMGLWLAFHDDRADPESADPVARESTRVAVAALISAQTSLDPQQMREWIPDIDYGAHAFGFVPDKQRGLTKFQLFLAARDSILPWIDEYSPWALVTADDPPVFLSYVTPPDMGKVGIESKHSANFGIGLQQRMRSVGVECQVAYPGATGVEFREPHEFLIARLKALPQGRAAKKPPG
jgi:acetyl esterase/lipase